MQHKGFGNLILTFKLDKKGFNNYLDLNQDLTFFIMIIK